MKEKIEKKIRRSEKDIERYRDYLIADLQKNDYDSIKHYGYEIERLVQLVEELKEIIK